jgi:hypothetical protein
LTSFRRVAMAHEVAGRLAKRLVGKRAAGIAVQRIYPPRGDLEKLDVPSLRATLRVVDWAASGWDAPAYWSQRDDFLNEVHALLIARVDGDIVGFSALQWLRKGRHRIVYVDATSVVPEHQNGGTATLLILETTLAAIIAHAGLPFMFSLRTENPVVYSAFYGVFGSTMYPQLDGTPPTPRVVAAAEAVAGYLDQADGLDRDALVIRGAHGAREEIGVERPPLPPCRIPEIQAYFDRHLNTETHDSLLLVIPANLATPVIVTRGFLRRRQRALARKRQVAQHVG